MCKQDRESVDYLLLHCYMARDLWSLVVFCLFGVQWVMHKRVIDVGRDSMLGTMELFGMQSLYASCGLYGKNKITEPLRNAIPLCIMWTIWKERNNRTFKGLERPMQI